MKLNKFDYISVISAVAAVVGFVMALVGCLVLSTQEGIGVNLSLSPVVYVGVVINALSLIGSIVGNALYEKMGMNRIAATVAIYLAVIAMMAVSVLVAYTILIPVLDPSNG